MDPFNDVQDDCWSQIHNLEDFILKTKYITEDAKTDFQYSYQDLNETLQDLSQAVTVSETNPEKFQLNSTDITNRKQVLEELEGKIKSLQNDWHTKLADPNRQREITTMSNRISQDNTGQDDPFNDNNRVDSEFEQFQQQEYIQNQDLQLDSIHQTMHNLNQQATMMGSELEEQGFMLEGLDEDMDIVGSKVQRGLKRVGFILEKNKERASDCCIGLLVAALCVLLILVIAL